MVPKLRTQRSRALKEGSGKFPTSKRICFRLPISSLLIRVSAYVSPSRKSTLLLASAASALPHDPAFLLLPSPQGLTTLPESSLFLPTAPPDGAVLPAPPDGAVYPAPPDGAVLPAPRRRHGSHVS